MVSEGASLLPGATDKDNLAPPHLSAGSFIGIVELLFGKDSSTKITDQDNTTPLHRAAGGGYTGLVELLLGNTAMKLAALKGYTDVLELLFGKGTSIDATDKDKNTPLHLAA